ncbi:MAG: DUF2849 domain-containing protein [Nitratireductor sp.]|nr:DUF2849 domain-containing protein [Nitratireductor sp.]
MSRTYRPRIITANHLMDGDAIYLTDAGTWSRLHEEAGILESEEAARAALDKALNQEAIAVGPYLAEVSLDGAGRPQPVHFREAFRTRGPSNYFHGKQEEV